MYICLCDSPAGNTEANAVRPPATSAVVHGAKFACVSNLELNVANVIGTWADTDNSIIVGELVVSIQILQSLLEVVIGLTVAEYRGPSLSCISKRLKMRIVNEHTVRLCRIGLDFG